jgi:SAM-dependent methyltransferase
MYFMIRPSKSFLFNFLERRLRRFNYGIGLDAGANNFKNRKMFKTEKYFGLDINKDALKSGLEKNNSSNTFGILADLEKLDLLGNNCIDVIVSTNTLYSLPLDKRVRAIENLCRLTAPDGYFFCELLNNNELTAVLEVLSDSFINIKKIYYKNYTSRLYESIFEKDGYLGSHKIAGTRPFLLFARLISYLEYLTCFWGPINKEIILVCNQKRTPCSKKEINLPESRLIGDRFYDILN